MTLHYRAMTQQQAATALEVFVSERAPALDHLRIELTAHGADPSAMLDGTPASLTALWQWITDRLLEDSAAASPTPPLELRDLWPSWAQHTAAADPLPSPEALALVDGFISYLAEVITTGAPEATWKVGLQRVKAYHWHKHPVLTSETTDTQVFLPSLPRTGTYRLLAGLDPVPDHEMCLHAAAAIASLRGDHPWEPVVPPAPLVEVTTRPGCFELELHGDLAHEHPALVDLLVEELSAQDGVESVDRMHPGALIVAAPGWDADRLELWAITWLVQHLPR
ncbi:hypothetical protein [Kocuria dechangensis]|uniref:hypothetical protein n=1 Tax=Kocuria dechangensis TaxID=1176249 RepID=UPI00166778CA|nr:hypothetical protein [Kocuria dechangensis]